MVFQDLALWPHLTVYQNLEFALKAQGLNGEVRRQRIAEVLQKPVFELFDPQPGAAADGRGAGLAHRAELLWGTE